MSKAELTIVGAPFSTFTRTMRMACQYLKIDYDLEVTLPHTKLAYQYNPFGRIPSILYKDQAIFETLAIRDFIDTKFNSSLTPKDLETRLKMNQIVSALGDYVFHHVVFGIAKPRDVYENQNKTEQEIQSLLEKPLKNARSIIRSFGSIISKEGPFLCGNELTWADYFVYPAMADLFSLPEGSYFQQDSPELYKWYTQFAERQEVIDTFPDTVADMRNKKKANL